MNDSTSNAEKEETKMESSGNGASQMTSSEMATGIGKLEVSVDTLENNLDQVELLI